MPAPSELEKLRRHTVSRTPTGALEISGLSAFAVLLATSAEEAIAALDERGGDVRALVTDINLGSIATGWDVARHAREMKPDMPVVCRTGSEAHEWASPGVPHGILVVKPFAASQDITAVSQP